MLIFRVRRKLPLYYSISSHERILAMYISKRLFKSRTALYLNVNKLENCNLSHTLKNEKQESALDNITHYNTEKIKTNEEERKFVMQTDRNTVISQQNSLIETRNVILQETEKLRLALHQLNANEKIKIEKCQTPSSKEKKSEQSEIVPEHHVKGKLTELPNMQSPCSKISQNIPSPQIRNKRLKFWELIHPSTTKHFNSNNNNNNNLTVAEFTDNSSIGKFAYLINTDVSSNKNNNVSESNKRKESTHNQHNGKSNEKWENNAEEMLRNQKTLKRTCKDGNAVNTELAAFRNEDKKNVARHVSKLLNEDESLGQLLLELLSADSRRLLLVMGTASEHFGGRYEDVVEQVKEADKDQDYTISSADYDIWVHKSFMNRSENENAANKEVERKSENNLNTYTANSEILASPLQSNITSSSSSSFVQLIRSWPLISLSCVKLIQKEANSSANVSKNVAHHKSYEHKTHFEYSLFYKLKSFWLTFCERVRNTFVRVAEKILKARNKSINSKDFVDGDEYREMEKPKEKVQLTQHISTCINSTTEADSKLSSSASSYIQWNLYWRLLIVAATPFLAFGILDNCTLILAGDVIDRTVAETLDLSEMAAAGLGGVVSGVAGIQVHGLAERWTHTSPPELNTAQKRSHSYGRASRIGNTLGMVIGLTIGMLPLFFIGTTPEETLRSDCKYLQKEAERCQQKLLKRVIENEENQRAKLLDDEKTEWANKFVDRENEDEIEAQLNKTYMEELRRIIKTLYKDSKV